MSTVSAISCTPAHVSFRQPRVKSLAASGSFGGSSMPIRTLPMPSSLPLADPQLADTAAALAAWRSIRAPSTRIPGDLWLRATELARRYGVARVAVGLKLDYTSLKRRLAATASSRAESARSTPQPADFVELNLGLPLAPPACVLIFSDRHGHALRIELAQAASGDITGITRSL